MTTRAHVTSVQAIEAFRAQLILFLGKARAAVEEVSDEIVRTRTWLENEQRARWERECRRCERVLDEAQQELFNAKISRLRTQTAAQLLAVERAKRDLRHAEEKRDAVKRWTREFGNRADPLGKQVEQLLTFLTTDMVKAAAHLGSVVNSLEAYTAVQAGPGALAAGLPPARDEAEPAPPLAAATLPMAAESRTK
jgi:hypothetical protein